jgi:arylsulfatase A-like enzyme
MLAGGGIKPGIVFGSSDKQGAHPSNNPVSPADIVATIYRCLGIANDLELQDRQSRPFQLVPWGDPIREIMA